MLWLHIVNVIKDMYGVCFNNSTLSALCVSVGSKKCSASIELLSLHLVGHLQLQLYSYS